MIMSLLNMSCSGAVFITAVVIIRAIAINRLPKKTFLALWMLVLLRLLIPFSIPSVFSVYTLISSKVSTPVFSEAETDRAIFAVPSENLVTVVPKTEQLTQLSQGVQASVSLPFIVWCAGLILLSIFFTISYMFCLKEFQTAVPVQNPCVAQWLKEHSLKRQISLRQSDKLQTPLTYGIFHPVILIPKNMNLENENDLQYILAHEYVHIRRLDAVSKLIMTAALCIHWFNPFVWVMYILFNRDIELACDESVINMLGENSKSAYSLMLIRMEAKKSGLLPLCNSFSKNAIEERITAIMKTKKTTIFALTAACLLVCGSASVFATSAQDNHNNSSSMEAQGNAETTYQESGILSYVDPQNGRTYYSVDDGKTFMAEEEYQEKFPALDIGWWTYDEYKQWLENEKVELQDMIGEKGYTGGRGEFVWTQEIVDETITMYENILEEIKDGLLVSKTVNGSYDTMLAQGNISETSVSASDFSEYKKFGLKWNDKKKVLYYNGKHVRYFFDGVNIENGQSIKLEYTDRNFEGETDVYTIRQQTDNGDGSVDLMGPLTGLAEYSQKEFDERVPLPASLSAEAADTFALGYMPDDVEAVTEGTGDVIEQATSTEGNGDGTTFADTFAKYESYGITYVESGNERNVYYNGKLVHNFADITPDGGAFSFTSSKDGGINIKTMYKNGILCGVEEIER